MTLKSRLRALFAEIVKEAESNPEFAERIAAIIETGDTPKPKKSRRRTPGVLDPFEVFEQGEEELRSRIGELDIEQLKDIVAEHGMDRSKLAMKWKTKDRFLDLIVTTVANRSRKGHAFRDMD
jgi:hypothetical protein